MWVKFLAQGNNSSTKVATPGIEPETFRLPGQCPSHWLSCLTHTQPWLAEPQNESWASNKLYTTQKCWCFVRSLWSLQHLPQMQIKFLSWHATSILSLHCATLSTATAHKLDHLSWSWHTTYQSSTLIARKSDITSSLHHFLASCNCFLFNSSPNKSCFGNLSSLMQPRWPSHCSRWLYILNHTIDHHQAIVFDQYGYHLSF